MTNPSQEVDRLEILMSTMNRDSLDFLKDIFPSKSFENLSVLIINQTTEQAILTVISKGDKFFRVRPPGQSKSPA